MTVQSLRNEAQQIRAYGTWLERVLFVVAVGALIFTMVNVTIFASAHGTDTRIAWLLDPIASLTFLSIMIGDGVLSRYGVKLGTGSTLVKLVAGGATWSMNIWSSVASGDQAAVLLHSVAPALVIGLADQTPRYRVKFAELTTKLEMRADAMEAAEVDRNAAIRQAKAVTAPIPVVTAAPAKTKKFVPDEKPSITKESAKDLVEVRAAKRDGWPENWSKPLIERYGKSRPWWSGIKKELEEAAA